MIIKSHNNLKNNSRWREESGAGFTMIELMITIVILSFGIIGAYQTLLPFVNATYNTSYRFTATYLAQEGLEIAKNIRDNNFIKSANMHSVAWSDGLLECALGCQLDYKTGTKVQTFANALKPYDPSEFLKLNADGAYSYDDGVATKFQRKVTITQKSGSDILKVLVQVTWNYNSNPFSFETVGYLYNWY